eukprot:751172-Hanusia_phi.AAC.5
MSLMAEMPPFGGLVTSSSFVALPLKMYHGTRPLPDSQTEMPGRRSNWSVQTYLRACLLPDRAQVSL